MGVPKSTIYQNLSNGCYLLSQIITLPRQDYGQQLKIRSSGMVPDRPPSMIYNHNCYKSPLEITVKPLILYPGYCLLCAHSTELSWEFKSQEARLMEANWAYT